MKTTIGSLQMQTSRVYGPAISTKTTVVEESDQGKSDPYGMFGHLVSWQFFTSCTTENIKD